jgi:diaminopimelate epimerase
MDYRNSDGSVSEMCGNGIRVFARHLVDEGLATSPIPVATRDGVKVLTVEGDLITADMGSPKVLGETTVGVRDGAAGGERSWPACHVDMGNPHAVAFVDDLADAGTLLEPPSHDPAIYPHGVNVEFVVRRGERHVALRVHERGSGETRSCGTGACAVMVAAALADGVTGPPAEDTAYRVDVPGGTLTVTWTADDRVLLTGPAVVVARGTTDL